MTKHRPDFATRVQPAEPQAFMDFIEVSPRGFIYAVPRTKPILDVLAKTGLLVREGRTVKRDGGKVMLYRYTMKEGLK